MHHDLKEFIPGMKEWVNICKLTMLTNWRANSMIVWIYAGKAFDKIQYSFMAKLATKWVKKERLSMIMAVCDKSAVSIILNCESWRPLLPFQEQDKWTHATLIQHSYGSPSHSNQTRKSSKKYPNWKRGDETVFICRWHDTIRCRCCSSVAKSCWTLCNPVDYSPPGSSVHGVFQARILESVAISFSRRSSQLRNQISVSCISRQILYHWATREAPILYIRNPKNSTQKRLLELIDSERY